MTEPDVFVVADNVFSLLGKTTADNFSKLKENISGVKQHHDINISSQPFYASLFDRDEIFIDDDEHRYTKFEQLLIASINEAIKDTSVSAEDEKTVLIISSTKGNIPAGNRSKQC